METTKELRKGLLEDQYLQEKGKQYIHCIAYANCLKAMLAKKQSLRNPETLNLIDELERVSNIYKAKLETTLFILQRDKRIFAV